MRVSHFVTMACEENADRLEDKGRINHQWKKKGHRKSRG